MLWEYIQEGGVVMWPLLACSFGALVVISERTIFWFGQWRLKNSDAVSRFRDCILSKQPFRAADFEVRDLDAVSRLVRRGALSLASGREVSAEIVDPELVEMKKGMPLLDTIITLAPLLGILGTVFGIIESFDVLYGRGLENPRAVIGGVAEALITTATGLTIASIALVFYNVFQVRAELVVSEANGLIQEMFHPRKECAESDQD